MDSLAELLFQCNLSNQRDAVFGKGGMAFRWEIGSSTVQTNSTGLNSLSCLPPRCIPFGFFLFGYPSVFLFVLVSPLFSISQSLTVSRSFCYLNLNVSNLNFSPSSTEKPRNENKTRDSEKKEFEKQIPTGLEQQNEKTPRIESERMEQELKEVDGVAGVASETSLSISPSPSFFSFFFFGLLIFATLSTCRRRRNSWRYQRPTQKKKKELFFCLLRLINSAELIRCQSCWDFGRFVRRIFGEKTTKKRKREKKNGNRWQGWPCPVVRVSMAIFGQNNPVGEWMGGQLGEQHSHNTAKPRFTMK